MKKILLALFLISLLSCEDDDPISDAYELLGFEVEATGEFDPYLTYIDTASNQILVFSSANLDLPAGPSSEQLLLPLVLRRHRQHLSSD